jgi:hypothetical protein
MIAIKHFMEHFGFWGAICFLANKILYVTLGNTEKQQLTERCDVITML